MHLCISFKPSIFVDMWIGLSFVGRLGAAVRNSWEIAKFNERILVTKSINLNTELLAAGCNSLKFPNNIKVHRLVGGQIESVIASPNELFTWQHYQGISFAVALSSGEIERVRIDADYLAERGQWIRNGGQTEWPKYYNSIVMAHLEVLKYAQKKKSRQLSAVHRIFRHYGEEIFMWIYP
jgi:hypothetical protein